VSDGFYVAMSAQLAMEARLEAIANNIANVNTTGYRASGIRFETTMAEVGGEQVAYTSRGETYIIRQQGPINYTGNSLDVAVDGEGWFALQTPSGMAYSRDGRFHLTDLGELVSTNGYPVLDIGGSPLTLDPTAGPVEIGENGAITQAGKQVGSIGVFLIPADAKLTRYDNSAVISDRTADPVEDPTANSVRQGYVEGSNVNPIVEMTRLIEASRAFEQATAALDQADQMSRQAVETLAPA
jgi:flagellar basal-body rod protein FlgF